MLLTVLAFVGMQAAFARAAFPRALSTATTALRPGAIDHPAASVDAARVPQRTNRRGVSPLGPYVPGPAPSPELLVGDVQTTPSARPAMMPRFVPSPPFHPPRALGT